MKHLVLHRLRHNTIAESDIPVKHLLIANAGNNFPVKHWNFIKWEVQFNWRDLKGEMVSRTWALNTCERQLISWNYTNPLIKHNLECCGSGFFNVVNWCNCLFKPRTQDLAPQDKRDGNHTNNNITSLLLEQLLHNIQTTSLKFMKSDRVGYLHNIRRMRTSRQCSFMCSCIR